MSVLSPLNRIALVCQEWSIKSTDTRLRKHFLEKLAVPHATLTRWLTGETREPTKGTPEQIFTAFIEFVDKNGPAGDTPTHLDINHETRAGLRKALEATSDKMCMGLIAARALPPSVRNLSDGNITAAKAKSPHRRWTYSLLHVQAWRFRAGRLA